MSFPYFDNQDDKFETEQENQYNPQSENQPEQNFIEDENEFIPIGDTKTSEQPPQTFDYINNMGVSIPIDEEEQQRIQKREEEEAERRTKIKERMDLELKGKNEKREKASLFMSEFEKKRGDNLTKRKELNIKNENDNLENKKLMKEGKKNPWETVVENIEIKESNYKGTKDVSRMRAVILNRKNDSLNQSNE